MRKGDAATIAAIVVIAAATIGPPLWGLIQPKKPDPGIPFYSTAGTDLKVRAGKLIDELDCKSCHSLWGRTLMQMTQNVPAPRLDGIGSLRDEQWFYRYLSADTPQDILPSRLKAQFRMPSYAKLSERDRRDLAAYMASLKVKDWYLGQTRKAEYEVLTGKPYVPGKEAAAQ